MQSKSPSDQNFQTGARSQTPGGSPRGADSPSPKRVLPHGGLARSPEANSPDTPIPQSPDTALPISSKANPATNMQDSVSDRIQDFDSPDLQFSEFLQSFEAQLDMEKTNSATSQEIAKPEPAWKSVPREQRIRGEPVPGMPKHKWSIDGVPVFAVGPDKPGRAKGSRGKLGQKFFDDVYAEWLKQGADVVKRAFFQDPVKCLDIMAKLMPAKIEIKDTTFEDIDRDTAADLIERIQRARERRTGNDVGYGAGTPRTIIDITPDKDRAGG